MERGVVKWFNDMRGTGAIQHTDGHLYYFSSEQILKGGFPYVSAGEPVLFSPSIEGQHFRATNLTTPQ
jgi:cold shock CspA family protein